MRSLGHFPPVCHCRRCVLLHSSSPMQVHNTHRSNSRVQACAVGAPMLFLPGSATRSSEPTMCLAGASHA
jgi:hypothetical protein